MNSFHPTYLEGIRFHPATTWALNQCAEARGMQEMWKTVKPEIMKKLRESAVIQSTESSNRIEGVEVEAQRLLPLIFGKSKPRDRSEEEIVGYRKALNYIHQHHRKIDVSSQNIRKLHELAQSGMTKDAGQWKKRNNEIIEFLPNGERVIRFEPVLPGKVEKFMEQLCLGYRDAVNNQRLPDLISVANFIFDFLCIHPFRDGNGRVSRLLTLLLLYHHGYEVGRFISLEQIIEETKVDYYTALKKTSEGWFERTHDLLPWWQHFLGTVKNAYQELRTRVESSTSGDTASSVIRQTMSTFTIPFAVADICKLHPAIGRELVKKVIFALKQEGALVMTGKGRGAKWKNKNVGAKGKA